MNLITSTLAFCLRASCVVAFGAIMNFGTLQNSAFGQRTGNTGSGTSSPVTTQGIAGSDIESSQIVSKSSEMPRFSGFDRLEKTNYIGGTSAYFPQRMSTGERLSSGAQRTSGNTRTTTTGSRTNRSAATMRNRNTAGMMGNMGRMGGLGGTNTNTVRSVTSLGYSLSESVEANRSPDAARVSQIENRINNNSKITALVPIEVKIENTTAILRGVVKNEHDRKLLEQLVKLEPGISKVQNELTLPGETE